MAGNTIRVCVPKKSLNRGPVMVQDVRRKDQMYNLANR